MSPYTAPIFFLVAIALVLLFIYTMKRLEVNEKLDKHHIIDAHTEQLKREDAFVKFVTKLKTSNDLSRMRRLRTARKRNIAKYS